MEEEEKDLPPAKASDDDLTHALIIALAACGCVFFVAIGVLVYKKCRKDSETNDDENENETRDKPTRMTHKKVSSRVRSKFSRAVRRMTSQRLTDCEHEDDYVVPVVCSDDLPDLGLAEEGGEYSAYHFPSL